MDGLGRAPCECSHFISSLGQLYRSSFLLSFTFSRCTGLLGVRRRCSLSFEVRMKRIHTKGFYCWISGKYRPFRFVAFYIPGFLVVIFNLVVAILSGRKMSATSPKAQQKMILYMCAHAVFFLLFLQFFSKEKSFPFLIHYVQITFIPALFLRVYYDLIRRAQDIRGDQATDINSQVFFSLGIHSFFLE